jgi:hypothetical protein
MIRINPTPFWLAAAVQCGIATGGQADALWAFAQAQAGRDADTPTSGVPARAQPVYYLGSPIAIVWGYALTGLSVTEWLLWHKLRILSDLRAAFMLTPVPPVVHVLQSALSL